MYSFICFIHSVGYIQIVKNNTKCSKTIMQYAVWSFQHLFLNHCFLVMKYKTMYYLVHCLCTFYYPWLITKLIKLKNAIYHTHVYVQCSKKHVDFIAGVKTQIFKKVEKPPVITVCMCI